MYQISAKTDNSDFFFFESDLPKKGISGQK